MASTDSPRDGLHDTIIISSDAEMDEHQSPARNLRRKRPCTDYSYSVYEALFDDPAPSELLKPPKKRKIPNLDTVLETANQGILDIFKVEHAKRKALKEEVQHLRAEMTRKDELINELETKGGGPFCVDIGIAQSAFPPLAQPAEHVVRLSLVLSRATR
ncbi:conserved hypothetical protein [Histoplasma capsulatum H143]|uniref:Uncharacterized protein n=1 Tax=Ajellomyces capsulatus (strain H143) TaxID=544712 RepID=C6H5W5_AJECH|nr:conserved hypothetical protein [Histoplasma capsulatum H143]